MFVIGQLNYEISQYDVNHHFHRVPHITGRMRIVKGGGIEIRGEVSLI